LAGLLLLAAAPGASARVAYVNGSDQNGGFTVPIDLATSTVGTHVPILGGEGSPSDVAITPDGTRAYVTNGSNDTVVPVDIATNTAGTAIPVGGITPQGIAITPDGSRAYVTNQNSNNVSVIDLASGTVVGSPIAVGNFPQGIAITPSGTRAYVTNSAADTVSVIDLASGTVVATIAGGIGNGPVGIAITPDGSRAYVTNQNSDTVSVIDLASGTVVGSPIAVGNLPFDVAVTPSGALAYVPAALDDNVTPIDVGTGTAGVPISVGGFPVSIAILPNGSRAYVVNEGDGSLSPVDIPGNSAGAPIPVITGQGDVDAIAIVPNQGPQAAFSFSPHKPKVKKSVSFDGGASIDSDGNVARYDWDFGDGKSGTGAMPHHSFAKAGTYKVTLTTTDNEGCSTTMVFTGQTAYCNGTAAARVTHNVKVVAPSACPTAEARGTSFTPHIRPGPTVPGVRVRLAASKPSRLDVAATLIWNREGHAWNAALHKLSVRVNHWRRVRFPIPVALLDELRVGSRVKVRLRIETHPLGAPSSCADVTFRTLRVRVVKVFPNAVQHGRVQ
jgi:YVTN family beta-propeller protein